MGFPNAQALSRFLSSFKSALLCRRFQDSLPQVSRFLWDFQILGHFPDSFLVYRVLGALSRFLSSSKSFLLCRRSQDFLPQISRFLWDFQILGHFPDLFLVLRVLHLATDSRISFGIFKNSGTFRNFQFSSGTFQISF